MINNWRQCNNQSKSREVIKPSSCISKYRVSGFWSVIYRADKLCQKCILFRAYLYITTSGKNFIVILLPIPEITGRCFHLKMQLSCLKRTIRLAVSDGHLIGSTTISLEIIVWLFYSCLSSNDRNEQDVNKWGCSLLLTTGKLYFMIYSVSCRWS